MIAVLSDDVTPDRFFSLLLALEAGRSVTTVDLASHLGVSVRTVLRDLRWLQEAGFPLHVQRGRWGGVTLLPGGALDTSRLTSAERDHLVLAGLDDDQRERLGAAEESSRAQRKVARGRTSPGEGLLPLSAVVTTDNGQWFGREPEGTSPGALVGDLRRGVGLRISYRGSEDVEPKWRVVDPYGLLAKGGRWYLVADEAGAPRLYALERLVDWSPLRTARRLRPGAALASVARELTARWESADELEVRALLEAAQLDRAKRILGRRLVVHPQEEGERLEITVLCRVLDDVRQLLQFAEHLTVTGPPEARERMREVAARTLQQYP